MHAREIAILPKSRAEWPEFGSEQAWKLAIEVFNARASSMLELVTNTERLRAYRTVLEDFAQRSFKDYCGTELTAAILAIEEDHVYALNRRISDWVNEGFKQLAKKATSEKPKATKLAKPRIERTKLQRHAEWVSARLKERGWDHNTPSGYGGPDRKTMKRILAALPVHDGTIDKLILALNKHTTAPKWDLPRSQLTDSI